MYEDSGTVKIELISAADLDIGLRTIWGDIQRSNDDLRSPYFSVEFTQAVAAVRRDVYVGILQSAGKVVGFFPHHRALGGFARPVGLGLSDYHGVIVEREVEWSFDELLRSCGLVRWKFDHALASQTQVARYCARTEDSPIIDTGLGLDAYLTRRLQLGGRQLKSIWYQAERLEREFGSYTFVQFDPGSVDGLDQLFSIKSRQCRETGAYDYFGVQWTRDLVRYLHGLRSGDFSGVLSSIYVGDTRIASHFGMRSRDVWHWWFPVYDRDFARYSPGLILLWEAVKCAATLGLRHIDLGKGMHDYKRRMMTQSIKVGEGEVALPSMRTSAMRVGRSLMALPKDRGVGRLTRYPAGIARRFQRRRRFT
jgi:CelD/BcsL family acetyltransferase involved in cellulose biosynthesis